jgi:hypothetical protein
MSDTMERFEHNEIPNNLSNTFHTRFVNTFDTHVSFHNRVNNVPGAPVPVLRKRV